MGGYSQDEMSGRSREVTTVEVSKDLHQRLKTLKPYDSVSFNDLIRDMADVYDEKER